jgi:hypothetical protein
MQTKTLKAQCYNLLVNGSQNINGAFGNVFLEARDETNKRRLKGG